VSRRTTQVAVLAATAALSLSGCANLHPGQAAKVGDHTITTDQVDAFAKPLCTYYAQTKALDENGKAPATADVRRRALSFLIQGELAHEFGDKYHLDIDPAELAKNVNGVLAGVKLPAGQREEFAKEVRYSIEGEMFLQQAIQAALAAAGQQATQETVNAARTKLYTEWSHDAGVRLDPRFGTWQNANAAPLSGSLSVPASGSDTSSAAGSTCG